MLVICLIAPHDFTHIRVYTKSDCILLTNMIWPKNHLPWTLSANSWNYGCYFYKGGDNNYHDLIFDNQLDINKHEPIFIQEAETFPWYDIFPLEPWLSGKVIIVWPWGHGFELCKQYLVMQDKTADNKSNVVRSFLRTLYWQEFHALNCPFMISFLQFGLTFKSTLSRILAFESSWCGLPMKEIVHSSWTIYWMELSFSIKELIISRVEASPIYI